MCDVSPTNRRLLESLQSEVHVWLCFPNEITDKIVLDGYRSILSAEEQDKYKRFHFENDRHSYLISHALVRKVLSSYCTVQPEEWRFTKNEHGKPDISAVIKSPAIKFNLSHTDGMSVCVVSLESDCGVDVENVQRESRTRAVAERMFSPAEVATMQSCGDAEMQRLFFDYWTLRESYVKALGTGLGGSSKAFYFSIEEKNKNSRVAKLNIIGADSKKSSAWNFVLLKPSLEHVIAVSFEMKQSGQSPEKSVNVVCKKFQA